jgi:hypothetical protein
MRLKLRLAALSVTCFVSLLGSEALSAAKGPCVKLNDEAAQRLLTVSLPEGAAVSAGQPLRIKWHAPSAPNKCKNARYLIVSFPNATRFEGERFFVLPPGPLGHLDSIGTYSGCGCSYRLPTSATPSGPTNLRRAS